MSRLIAVLLLLVASPVYAVPPNIIQAASNDRASIDKSQHIYIRYLWLPVDGEELAELGAALKFVVCSSSKALIVDDHVPVAVADDLYRIDLQALEWDVKEFNKIAATDPYVLKNNYPLVLNGVWLMHELLDGTESDAYYRLLYGPVPPKTKDEFLKYWGVDRNALEKKNRELAKWIEKDSGVSVQKYRAMFGWPSEVGSLWETQDALKLDLPRHPVQTLGKGKFDGQEWIIAIQKQSVINNTRGYAQAYWLTNAAGNRVESAPTKLVIDHTSATGTPDIVNPISCMTCHENGLNYPTTNAIRFRLEKGVRVSSYAKEDDDEYKSFLFEITDLVKRQNEDFSKFVKACNGLEGTANASVVRKSYQWYAQDVTRAQAAYELQCTPDELVLAFQKARDLKLPIGVLADLASDIPLARESWEQDYTAAYSYIQSWRFKK